MSTPIKHILIAGSGTMGQQIGLQCAMFGFNVTLYDVEQAALPAALKAVQSYLDHMTEAARLTTEQAKQTLARITLSSDLTEAAAQADLVSESVPEDPAIKRDVFSRLHQHCPPHTLFTTNTSMLVPSLIAAATGRPAQFAALHFHQPVWEANLVDVMPHPGTATETLARLEEFARQIGQIPIVLQKESYGYVFNAMYSGLNREAITLAANGVASIEDIDRSWMVVTKMRIGPLGMLDYVGLETAWHISDYWADRTGDTQLKTNAAFLKGYLDKGWLGVKSGRGFYCYPDPAYAHPDFLRGQP